MINFDFHNLCTGCRACGDVCPTSSISFMEDRDGFVMPTVNTAACVNCGRCDKACPALNHTVQTSFENKCYATYHKEKDIRTIGSSGSTFYALAERTIEAGGSVYAAALDENLHLRHTRATSLDEVLSQMKSKYLQSDTKGIYKQVMKDLREGRDVLFVGTPCQCQALHNMLPDRLREKLLLADFICHGVPSQSLFDKSICHYESVNSCKVNEFSFREKTKKSLRNYKIEYTTKDGERKTAVGDLDDIPFCYGFFYHYTQRNSCYACKQRTIARVSDLTLGDFWGITKLKPEISDFETGYSSVIANTQKGQAMIEQMTTCNIEEIPDGVSFVAANNRAYTKPDGKSSMRGIFFFCLRHFGYAFCERHFLKQQRSILDRLFFSLIIQLDNIKTKK